MTQITNPIIEHMTQRFLQWRFPSNFNPDGGISYTRPNYAPNVDATPVGTNLLDYSQAKEMVLHMVQGLDASQIPADWKITPSKPTNGMIDAAGMATITKDWQENALNDYTAMIAAAPPSPFVMVAREDLRIVLNPPATQDCKTDQLIADAEARLTQALETQPQAEG